MRAAIASVVTVQLVVALGLPARARAEAEPEPAIELYTMGRGETLPERFGHAALCVRESDRSRADHCYDYGAFDASEPLSLGFRFLRGESVFFVAVRDRESMIRHYEARDRAVWRQPLPLDPEQAREAAAMLAEDAKPENRQYHYHHYFDNCATRVRDIIDEVTGGALSSVEADPPVRRSYRDFTREGFAEFSGILLATQLALGRAVDSRPTAYERMFLPEALREGVEDALGVNAELVHARQAPPVPSRPGSGSPAFPIAGFALFLLIAASAVWARYERAAVGVTAAVLALLGLILWAVAAVSPLAEVRYNELLLVFVPTDAALPFLSVRRRIRYAAGRLIVIFAAAVLYMAGVLVQPLAGPMLLALLPMTALALAPAWKAWLTSQRA